MRRAALLALVVTGAALVAPTPAAAQDAEPGILFAYSFEADEDLATGPDTFAVFELRRGEVSLLDLFRTSGFYSVEIRDVADDGDFPELQAYFPHREAGWLFLRFAILFTDPAAPFDVALAGPQHYTLRPGGIAFWLRSRADGHLVHVSDSFPRKLFVPRPFVWYEIDLAYDVDAGRYDLRIFEEGRDEPLVDLRARPNATASPGSAVDQLSFVGDRGDRTNTVLYVDDVAIGAREALRLDPFVAPRRRRLFVDRLPTLLALAPALTPAPADDDAAPDAVAVVELEALAAADPMAAALRGDGDLARYAAWSGEGRHAEARDLARLAAEDADVARDAPRAAAWRELAADAALRHGDAAEALLLYREVLPAIDPPARLLLKLSDVHHLLGDVEAERRLRETVFGRLD